jgi:Domain of unknown function DUF29
MATSVRSARAVLYNRDFAAWAEAQAEALRAGRPEALDLAHLAEEIGDLSNRERDALESHLETLVLHPVEVALPADSAQPELGGHDQGRAPKRPEAAATQP